MSDDSDEEPEEVVVIVKRTKTVFEPHKEEFYRDKASKKHNYENQYTLKPKNPDLKKFWQKRYYLFSKFDRGVMIDDESWYSVTPEPMAKDIAQRVSERVGDQNNDQRANVLDAFCGVGGNTVQFGRKCGFCVASDMDPQKLEYARHNT